MCYKPLIMYPFGKTANGKQRLVSPSYAYEKLGRLFDPDAVIPLPCGKCPGCLWDRRSAWLKRLLLESKSHKACSFVTLTYRPSDLPPHPSRRHIQLFLKKLRNAGRDNGFKLPPLRYFIVSERGDKSGRIHYHGIIFGVDFMSPEWKPKHIGFKHGFPIFTSLLLSEIWSHGYVTVDSASPRNIAYISNYILHPQLDNIKLSSCGLGRGFFLDDVFHPSSLNDESKARFTNGFFFLGGLDKLKKYPIPSSFFRYLEKYDPVLFHHLKQLRRDIAVGMSHGSPTDHAAYLKVLQSELKETKTL